jgi:subtilisin family serine protease
LTQNETSTIEFSVSGNARFLYLTLWKNFADTISFELISPSGRSTGIIQPLQGVTHATLDSTAVTVIYSQPNHYALRQEVFFLLSATDTPVNFGIWKLIARGDDIVDGRFDIWLPTVEDVTMSTYFLKADINFTLTLPSTVQEVISVGGYNATVRIATVFSGRGATPNSFNLKPDLVAPSVNILTTRSGGGYDTFTGTCMASPVVCGGAALMMEWGVVRGNDPFLYGQRVKAFLRRGANRDFAALFPSNQWGYGALSLCTTMTDLVNYTRTGGAFS